LPVNPYATKRPRIRKLIPMSLGAELVLLAVDDEHGDLRFKRCLGWVIAGADLVDMALSGQITLSGLHLVRPVADSASGPTVAEAAEVITVSEWIARCGTTERVNEEIRALEGEGAVHVTGGSARVKQTSVSGVHIADPVRQSAIIERFRGAARGGDQVGARDEALVLLADAVGLTQVYLRGPGKRRARKQIALLLDAPLPALEPDRTARVIARRTLIAVTRRLASRSGGPGLDTWSNHQDDLRWAIGAGFDTGPMV
jgi:hypothetical protein